MKVVVSLRAIIDELQILSCEHHAYLDQVPGELIALTNNLRLPSSTGFGNIKTNNHRSNHDAYSHSRRLSQRIILTTVPRNMPEETPVIVTFLEGNTIDLGARGIDEAKAADLRARLATFAEDWGSPEMDVYDHYDAAKASL